VSVGLVEPAWNVVANRAERLARRPPQPDSDLDRDGRRPLVGQRRKIVTGACPFDQQRAPSPVAA